MKNLSGINDNLDIATKKYVDDSVGAISIPTKVSDLTNDSGFVTTDEKLKVIGYGSLSAGRHYPILTTSSSSAETKYRYDEFSLGIQQSSGGGGIVGLSIGSNTGTSSLGYEGRIILYGKTNNTYTTIKPSITATRELILPDASGTVALTSDIPIVPTKVSDLTNDAGYTTNVGTITGITMNGSSKGTSGVVNLGTVLTSHQDISGKVDTLNTDSLYGSFRIDYDVYINQPSVYMQGASIFGQVGKIYVETAEGDSSYVANVIEATDPNGSTANAGITVYIHTDQDENVVGSIRLDASGDIKLGSDTNISIFSEESMDLIALNDDIHINSNSGNVYIQNLVTPTLDADAATKRYVDDSIPTVPTITLNGSSTTSPSFYAPTTAGTSGYYLKSNGSGAPTWAQVYSAQIVRW